MLSRAAAAVGAGLVGTVIGAILLASPAFAEVRVNINNLPSTFFAGQPRSFYSTVTNTDKIEHKIHRVISIRMDGLSPGEARLTRQDGQELALQGTGNGLSAVDQTVLLQPAPTRIGSRQTSVYTLMFTSQAPTARGSLTVEVIEGDHRLDEASDGFSVRAGFGASTSTRTKSYSPEPTISGDPVQAILGQEGSYQPLPDRRPVPRSDGVPWFLYVFGGILVAGGGALIYWLWRNRRIEAAEQFGVPASAFTRPARSQVLHAPTAVLPTVRRPYGDQAGHPYGEPTEQLPRRSPQGSSH
jgi:hypothetical protein